MKRLTYFLLTLLLCLGASAGFAQAGVNSQSDDEFNVFLLALAIAFCCIVAGSILAGSILVALALLAILGLVTAGVLSAGVLVGLYRRSISAGFKTAVAIAGCTGGIAIGEVAFYLINRIYHLHLSGVAVVLVGGFCGLVGGLLLGMVLFQLIRIFLNYCRAKLSF